MNTVEEILDRESFFDAAILRHGFTDYMRDYEIMVSARDGPPNRDVHRYQFVGCVEATYRTAVPPGTFSSSLSDEFVLAGPDYRDKADPDGFVWGVRYSTAYPGLRYVTPSAKATSWSRSLGRPMHEVTLETEVFSLQLVFAEVRYEYLGHDPELCIPKHYPIGTHPRGAA